MSIDGLWLLPPEEFREQALSPEERKERELCRDLRAMGVDTVAVLLTAWREAFRRELDADLARMDAEAGVRPNDPRRRGPKEDDEANWKNVFALYDYKALMALHSSHLSQQLPKIEDAPRWLAEWFARDCLEKGRIQEHEFDSFRDSYEEKWRGRMKVIRQTLRGKKPWLLLQDEGFAPAITIDYAFTKAKRFSTRLHRR